MRTAGIIGFPVAHSLSPVFQQAAFEHSGLDVRYEPWATPPSALEARVRSLRWPECLGANVTIPHKEAVIPFLDELGGQSARLGAVNTIVNRGGRLFGFNTDGPGFLAALRNEAAFDPAGARVLLLGAGGAARGIAFALAEARPATIAIWNRSPHRALRLAREVGAAGADATAVPLPDPGGFDLVVNCTSIGMHGGGAERASPCRFEGAIPGALAADIVYRPAETPFLAAAHAAGLRVLGGLPMLIFQGALAFELWTGVPAPTDVMFEAARQALRAEPVA